MVTKKSLSKQITKLEKDVGVLQIKLWNARQEIFKRTEIITKESVRIDVVAFTETRPEYICDSMVSVAQVLPLLLEHLGLEVHKRPDKVEQALVYLQKKEKKDGQD